MLIHAQDGHFDLHVSLNRGDEMLTKGGRSHPRVIYVNVMWRSAACLFSIRLSAGQKTWLPFFPPRRFYHTCVVMQTQLTTVIGTLSGWAFNTSASHHYKLKKTSSLSARQFLCFHIFTPNTEWKSLFFFFFKSFFITLCFQDVFLFTSNGTQTQHSVDSRVWPLA